MHRLLYLVVAISGACVLALEILGTRILGPFYGVSIFLWSSLITVTLAALSVGYLFGGRIADRDSHWKTLALMTGFAGIWVLLVPFLRSGVINLSEGLGLRAAVLTSATILFAPPLVALGMISPCAIRLKAQSLGEVGQTAGNLYAISTLASVVAAIATGFWLVPTLGVNGLLALIGALLLLTAALCFAAERKAIPTITIGVIAVASFFIPLPEAGATPETVEITESAYANLQVMDHEESRYLLIDGGVHTIEGFGTGESHHRYVPVIESTEKLFDEPGRALLLGLGGGVLARDLHEDGWAMDTVEIDPEVVRIARRYFSLPPMMPTETMDARRFLSGTDRDWDLVLMDAFGSSSIPFHLVTREMFELCAQHLADDGVLAINIECRGWNDPFVHAMGKTLRTSFSSVWALPIAEPRNKLGNLILVATNREGFEFPDDRLDDMSEAMSTGNMEWHWWVVQQNHSWDNRFEPGLDQGMVLTDNRSPVELWSEQINLEARRDLHKFFGRKSRVW